MRIIKPLDSEVSIGSLNLYINFIEETKDSYDFYRAYDNPNGEDIISMVFRVNKSHITKESKRFHVAKHNEYNVYTLELVSGQEVYFCANL